MERRAEQKRQQQTEEKLRESFFLLLQFLSVKSIYFFYTGHSGESQALDGLFSDRGFL